jgi:glycosyltransferase involved in cell wall biosynthesis
MQRLGHQVILLAGSERRSNGAAATLQEEAPAVPGVPTFRLLRSSRHLTALDRFTSTFVDPGAETLIRRLLERVDPDVLHLQHTLNLSARLISLGAAGGAAVVATAHDFWPICQRIDLLRPDGQICPGPRGGLSCAACLPPLRSGGASGGVWGLARRTLEVGSRLTPYMLRTQLLRGAFALAHRVTCPSRSTADLLLRGGIDGRRMVVVDYGVPPLPGVVVDQPRPHTPFRFGFLGTLGPHKGLWVPLRAAELLGDGPWRLEIHGGPVRDPELRDRLDRARAGGRVEFLGPYRRGDLPRILSGLDALIIPSLWPETGPLVWMEAVAAGLPVIGSRIGAIADRIEHDRDGLLVPAGDDDALAGAMEALMLGYPRLRQGALERVVRTVSDAALEFLTVYREALEAAA